MKNQCFLQLYLNHSWQDVASLSLFDPPSRGWQAKNYIAYTTSHAINYMDKQDANALAWNLPVTLDATQSEQWPGFIMDLLPQGYGRQELLRQLDLPPNAGQSADWSLLMAGASNPIGYVKRMNGYSPDTPANLKASLKRLLRHVVRTSPNTLPSMAYLSRGLQVCKGNGQSYY